MQPQKVQPVEYFVQPINPWPPILRTMGLLAIVFGAADACIGALNLRFAITDPRPVARELLFIAKVTQIVAGGAVIVVGVLSMRERPAFQLALCAACGVIGVRLLELGAFVVRYPGITSGDFDFSFLINRLSYSTLPCIFPVLVVLLMRQFSKQHPIAATAEPRRL
jgi:hypothetical protein